MLIDRGVYREEVIVTTPSLVLRGVDRNEVVIDGEFVRGNGVMALADGVAVENMTARNHLLNGFFWTGVRGFRGSFLTAINNMDYGIYAFDSQDGLFEHSYASGSPDSGFYIGQCQPCRTVLTDLVAENNALGYSGTNSGGELYIVRSIFRNNQAGIAPNTLDSELLAPQRGTTIVANLVVDNSNADAPTRHARSARPRERDHPARRQRQRGRAQPRRRPRRARHPGDARCGTGTPGPRATTWCAATACVGSRRADLAIGSPGTPDNCFAANEYGSAAPPRVEQLLPCGTALPPARRVRLGRHRGARRAHRARPARRPSPRRLPHAARCRRRSRRCRAAPARRSRRRSTSSRACTSTSRRSSSPPRRAPIEAALADRRGGALDRYGSWISDRDARRAGLGLRVTRGRAGRRARRRVVLVGLSALGREPGLVAALPP